jgi:hypothetical protein
LGAGRAAIIIGILLVIGDGQIFRDRHRIPLAP